MSETDKLKAGLYRDIAKSIYLAYEEGWSDFSTASNPMHTFSHCWNFSASKKQYDQFIALAKIHENIS